ncbi:hypothetical protein HZS_7433 [Henneguya salminicola]|nr:hypothetical protein HZS_7433 [Henneguya salminicola]
MLRIAALFILVPIIFCSDNGEIFCFEVSAIHTRTVLTLKFPTQPIYVPEKMKLYVSYYHLHLANGLLAREYRTVYFIKYLHRTRDCQGNRPFFTYRHIPLHAMILTMALEDFNTPYTWEEFHLKFEGELFRDEYEVKGFLRNSELHFTLKNVSMDEEGNNKRRDRTPALSEKFYSAPIEYKRQNFWAELCLKTELGYHRILYDHRNDPSRYNPNNIRFIIFKLIQYKFINRQAIAAYSIIKSIPTIPCMFVPNIHRRSFTQFQIKARIDEGTVYLGYIFRGFIFIL